MKNYLYQNILTLRNIKGYSNAELAREIIKELDGIVNSDIGEFQNLDMESLKNLLIKIEQIVKKDKEIPERGNTYPNAAIIYAMCIIFDIDYSDLFTQEQFIPKPKQINSDIVNSLSDEEKNYFQHIKKSPEDSNPYEPYYNVNLVNKYIELRNWIKQNIEEKVVFFIPSEYGYVGAKVPSEKSEVKPDELAKAVYLEPFRGTPIISFYVSKKLPNQLLISFHLQSTEFYLEAFERKGLLNKIEVDWLIKTFDMNNKNGGLHFSYAIETYMDKTYFTKSKNLNIFAENDFQNIKTMIDLIIRIRKKNKDIYKTIKLN